LPSEITGTLVRREFRTGRVVEVAEYVSFLESVPVRDQDHGRIVVAVPVALVRETARWKQVGLSKLTNFENRRNTPETGRYRNDFGRPLDGRNAPRAAAAWTREAVAIGVLLDNVGGGRVKVRRRSCLSA
jgi:hypothetical protein